MGLGLCFNCNLRHMFILIIIKIINVLCYLISFQGRLSMWHEDVNISHGQGGPLESDMANTQHHTWRNIPSSRDQTCSYIHSFFCLTTFVIHKSNRRSRNLNFKIKCLFQQMSWGRHLLVIKIQNWNVYQPWGLIRVVARWIHQLNMHIHGR